MTSKDLVELYPPLISSQDVAPIVLENCKFFDLFDADPVEAQKEMEKKRQEAKKQHGAKFMQEIKKSKHHHPLKKKRQFDFRLEDEEKAKLAANGVAVSQRMQAESFAETYYRLYSDDLPVFVTTDSILHAWHRSFDALLVKLETNYLSPQINKILELVFSKVKTHALKQDEFILKAAQDVEVFVTIALCLLRGELKSSSERPKALWSAIQAEKMTSVELFSAPRTIDFSLFKPRGHYTKSEELKRYFQAMMWLGTIDFRIAGGEDQDEDLHQLLCATLLVYSLQESQSLDDADKLDALISSLIADGDLGADSLSASQLARLATSRTGNVLQTIVEKPSNFSFGGTEERHKLLVNLQEQITQKELGAQLITGHPTVENASSEPTAPPTSFVLLGQRFVWSSFIFTRLVYDQVMFQEVKLPRRIPSAVDVAFALFGNNNAAQELGTRMEANPTDTGSASDTGDFVPHRDGIPFASNLVALRQVIDQEFDHYDNSSTTASKNASISTLWLRALRVLSKPSPNSSSTFHSDTWQHRQMNTQIASFTQLRHDSVLYAKQSYTCGTRCEYPDGMVDPYPLFWQLMREMAVRMKDIARSTLGEVGEHHKSSYDFQKAVSFFQQFASTMTSLEGISVCQANDTRLNDEQMRFLKSVMEESFGSGATQYRGWYPSLFFDTAKDSGKRDVLVVDVHTDIPSIEHGDPGCVLHLGVGDPFVGFFVVDNTMYAGPVFSSYEFLTPIDDRLNDTEFQEKLPVIYPPHWARDSYLCDECSIGDAAQKELSSEPPHNGHVNRVSVEIVWIYMN